MANDLARRTWPWMTLAVILVAVFMYWLHVQSSQLEGTFAASAADTADVPAVPDSVFAQAPERFRDRLMLHGVRVDRVLGRASFSLELPGREGYPAVLERQLVEEDMRVVGGDELDLAGEVYALNDSIISVWSQRGIFDMENRDHLAGNTTFFLVDSLDFVVPGEEEAEAEEGQQQEQTAEGAPGR